MFRLRQQRFSQLFCQTVRWFCGNECTGVSGALVGVTLVSKILRRHSPTVATDSSARVDRCGRPDAASARSRPSSVDAS